MRTGHKLNRVVAVSAATMLGLAGCSFSASTTPDSVSAESVASSAEDALEAQVGSRPIIDCGSDDFKLAEGETRDCVLTADPPGPDKYQAVVTLNNVDKSEGTYTVNVQVGEQPLP